MLRGLAGALEVVVDAGVERGLRGKAPGHLCAVTANAARALDFGVPRGQVFGFWDWVGGRYSLWSAVGLPFALAAGMERFDELRDGARAMDEHFARAPLEKNLPVVMGLLEVWNVNFRGCGHRAVLPYDERLRLLPAYLQQLEMESSGKSVTREGDRVGTLMWNNQEHMEVYLAVPTMGAVLHTLNLRLFPDQLSYVINHAGDKVIIVDDTLVGVLARVIGTLTSLEHVIVAGQGDASVLQRDVLRYDELLAQASPHYDWPELDDEPIVVDDDRSPPNFSLRLVAPGPDRASTKDLHVLYRGHNAVARSRGGRPITARNRGRRGGIFIAHRRRIGTVRLRSRVVGNARRLRLVPLQKSRQRIRRHERIEIEHEAVLVTLRALARRGWRTTLLPVGATGIVDPAALEAALDDETALVSIMHAQNVVGTIIPETERHILGVKTLLKNIGRHPGRYANREYENIRRSGEPVWIAWTNRALYEGGSKMTEILCIGNDITKQKHNENLLKKCRVNLEEKVKLRTAQLTKMNAPVRLDASCTARAPERS